MTKVLVTGGCGFIGRWLIQRLLAEHYDLLVIDNLSTGNRKNIPDEVTLIQCDVADVHRVPPTLLDIDIIIHLAARTSLTACEKNWFGSHHDNYVGFLNLISSIQNQQKKPHLIYASSAAVYGDVSIPMNENQQLKPRTLYGVDKLSCELLAQACSLSYGLKSIGLRFFNVFGPGQNPDSQYSGVITRFQQQITENKPITFYGNGEQTRDFIYVEDVVEAICSAMSQTSLKTGVFNVCTGNAISIANLASTMMNLFNVQVPIKMEQKRAGEVIHSLGDGGKAQRILNFTPQYTLKEGLKQCIEFERNQN
jgi:UDP-glucose 4-epimerase